MTWKEHKQDDWFTVYWDGEFINSKDDWYNGTQSYHDRTYAEAMRLIGRLKKNEAVSRIWLDFMDWDREDSEMVTLMYIEKKPFRWHVDLSDPTENRETGWKMDGATEKWFE